MKKKSVRKKLIKGGATSAAHRVGPCTKLDLVSCYGIERAGCVALRMGIRGFVALQEA